MSNTITTDIFDSVLTITFRNTGRGNEVCTWVCEPAAYEKALLKLEQMPHIEILNHGRSHVERI